MMTLLFQRMDLGECPKIHDLALKADYEMASKDKDYFYDIDVSMMTLQTRSWRRQDIEMAAFLPLNPSGSRGIVVTVRAAGWAAAKLAEPISL